jgi:hypothetical protein
MAQIRTLKHPHKDNYADLGTKYLKIAYMDTKPSENTFYRTIIKQS